MKNAGPPKLQLRSINKLLKDRFVVPSYQRGFRWGSRQVEALLDDLAAFQGLSRQGNPNAFYCLQPVVVRSRSEGEWELVDGQQRLTTIFLILGALREIAKILDRGCYEISYETRDGSADFLKDPTPQGAVQYIDYHHIYEAHLSIQQWFAARDPGIKLQLINSLTSPDGQDPNVRVIWYELGSNQDPEQAFVRLNVGRIPLTSAELIRAQLLRSDRGPLDPWDAQQLPQDWDLIERRLQDDGYWYFLQSNRTAPPARIEYMFDIFIQMKRINSIDPLGDDPIATFLEFQNLLDAPGAKAWSIWQEFKKLTQTLEEWYDNRTLYHLVGFLVATATPERVSDSRPRQAEARILLNLLRVRSNSTGTGFDRHLRLLAWKRFVGPQGAELPDVGLSKEDLMLRIAERIEVLEYGASQVRSALLLFNIAGLLEQTALTQRFQFDGYKTNTWDIEHVRSVAEYRPRAAADRRRWLEHAREFVESPLASATNPEESKGLVDQINLLNCASSPDEDIFLNVFTRVRALSGETELRGDNDALSNLTLLDMGTNRSYKNAIFPVKRSLIIGLDKQGQFVPSGTRNVFLKYYSPHAAQLMLWDGEDQDAYGQAILETLTGLFTPLMRKTEGK